MPARPRVLISGASVSGPTLAFWLCRYGFDVTIVELSVAVRGGGYPIDIRGAAVDVLDRMRITGEVRAVQGTTETLKFVDKDGVPIGVIDPEALTGGTRGRDIEVPRGDLTSVLYTHTRQDIAYIFDNSITALETEAGGIRVSFRKGADRFFDVVIGADGLHSNVRKLVFGPESSYLRHLGMHFTGFTVPNFLGLRNGVVMHATPRKMVALYGFGERPTSHAFFVFPSDEASRTRLRDIDEQKAVTEQMFADHGWEAPRLLELMRGAGDFFSDSVSQIHMPRWSRGRIGLVGDAAYAPSFLSGQGTSIALVGAYVLAGELAQNRTDFSFALKRYESVMRSFVERNQGLALGMGARMLVPANRVQLWIRNQLALRVLPVVSRLGYVDKTAAQAASALTLPDYPNQTAS